VEIGNKPRGDCGNGNFALVVGVFFILLLSGALGILLLLRSRPKDRYIPWYIAPISE